MKSNTRKRHAFLLLALSLTFILRQTRAAETPETVTIPVHADRSQGEFKSAWNFFGYDEPNYTYAPNGKKLLNEIGRLSATAAYIRVPTCSRPAMAGHRQSAGQLMGFRIVASFPKFRDTPVILGESDPEGCAACSAERNPQNGYRNGALYASYMAEAYSQTLALAEREHVKVMAAVTWAFEFEDQPYFAGFRAFTAWKEVGSPQSPTPEQYNQLESAGQLQLLTSPEWIQIEGGSVRLKFDLPRQAVSLARLTW